jgi:hypothetical protein
MYTGGLVVETFGDLSVTTVCVEDEGGEEGEGEDDSEDDACYGGGGEGHVGGRVGDGGAGLGARVS